MAKIASFTVQGRGRFPVDMLRYDSAWPRDGASAESILVSEDGEARKVRLNLVPGYTYPTRARWSSFGWTVIEAFDEWGNPVPTFP